MTDDDFPIRESPFFRERLQKPTLLARKVRDTKSAPRMMMLLSSSMASSGARVLSPSSSSLSSSSSSSSSLRTPKIGTASPLRFRTRRRRLRARAEDASVEGQEKRRRKKTSSPNLIDYQSTPYTDKDGENPRPWYIEENGKANGVVVIVVFLLSQVFIGTVLQPLAVFINQLWEPIVGGHLYVDNLY